MSCNAYTEFHCQYVDRSGRLCNTPWCEAHIREENGQTFCRRHAVIAQVLTSDAPRPLLENRAPSLVHWLSEDVSHAMQESGEFARTSVTRVPLHEVPMPDGGYGWEEGWTMIANNQRLSVTLLVPDALQTDVNLKVGSKLISLGSPPWVNRQSGHWVRVDPELHAMFRERLVKSVVLALQIASLGDKDQPPR
jgi:hypothetical protein